MPTTLTEKTCRTCEQIKPVAAFSRRAKSLDGLQSKCKACCAASKKEWLAKNVDHVIAYQAEYSKAYRTENASRLADAKREYHIANVKTIVAKATAWQRENAERVNLKNAKWRKDHPASCLAKCNRRRAAKFNATPSWADHKAIEKIYQEASKLIGYEVDHIVPLNSKIVSGLHVPANLQIIRSQENRSKGNRFWPNMP